MSPLWRSIGALCCLICLSLGARTHAQYEALDSEEQSVLDEAGSDADELADEPAPESAPEAEQVAPPLPAWTMQLSAEAGFGMRAVDLPRDGVLYQVRTGLFPALGLGFALDYHSSASFSVGLMARYQSSIGLVLEEQLTDGTTARRKTRSHRVEIGVTPTWIISQSGWALAGAVGYALSELDPENHLVTPSYHLAGPYARATLRIPLGSDRLRLCLGPEGQLVVQMGDELLARGVTKSGFAAGVSAALELHLGERWAVAASYRELRFVLSSAQPSNFTDVSHFVTAQLTGAL